jgi:hypothetical protein
MFKERREAVRDMASRGMTPNEMAASLSQPVQRIYRDLRAMEIPLRTLVPVDKRMARIYNSGIHAGTFTDLVRQLSNSEFNDLVNVAAKEGTLSKALLKIIRQRGGFSQ